jgi:hypothetical protein
MEICRFQTDRFVLQWIETERTPYMKNCSIFILLIPVVFFMPTAAEAQCRPEKNTSGHFETRYGIPEHTEFSEIYREPTEIFSEVTSFRQQGRDRLIARSDFHAVFPGTKDKMVRALLDIEGQPEIFYRIVESRLICSSPGPPRYWKQYEKTSFKFLFLGTDYEFIMNVYEEELDNPKAFATKWNLEESLDDAFFAFSGSWYFEDITYRGKAAVYARYYTMIDFKEIIFGLEFALLNFSKGDVTGSMKDLYYKSKEQY